MPLEQLMVVETNQLTNRKVTQLINKLYRKNHIDEMTKKWLCQTPDQPRIPVFYTLTKIHKPVRTGRPATSGCEGPTEKLSAFVDKLLQPIAQQQKSYLKDTTAFINFIERTKVTCLNGRHEPLYKYTTRRRGSKPYAKHTSLFIKIKSPSPSHY